MKKYIMIIALSLFVMGTVNAQRYLPGQRAVQLTAGVVDGFNLSGDKQAFCAGVALSSYTKNGNRWVFGAEYLQKQYRYSQLVPLSQFTLEGGYYINFLSDRSKTFFFSVGLSGMAGYETINWGTELLSDGSRISQQDNFLYGGAGTFEIEAFVSDRVALLLNARERLLMGSDINKFHFQMGVGVKFIIN